MEKISSSSPELPVHRNSYPEERTFREIQTLMEELERSYKDLAAAINGLSQGGTTASRPSSPKLYDRYYDTTISKLILYDGSNWVDTMGVVS